MSEREKHKQKKRERRRERERRRTMRNGIITTFVLAAVVVAAVVFFVSRGGGGGGDGAASFEEPAAVPTGTPIAVAMGDNFFQPSQLTVSAEEPVVFQLKNDGQLIHNLRLAGLDGEYDTSDDIVSDNAQGGEETALGATLQAGTYSFKCDFHPIEMIGTLVVQ